MEMSTRRTVLRRLLLLLLAPLAVLWQRVARRRAEADGSRTHRLPLPRADGVVFHGPIILRRRGGEVTAHSARCPHLGCTIAGVDGGELVCPCHGSRFTFDGRLLQGPAVSGLVRLEMEQDPGDETLITITGP